MPKNIFIIILLLVSSITFSQDKQSTSIAPVNTVKINNNSTALLVPFDKSEWTTIIGDIKKDSLIKPELRLFAVDQRHNTSIKNDSIIMPEPELIPFTGYKNDKDQ